MLFLRFLQEIPTPESSMDQTVCWSTLIQRLPTCPSAWITGLNFRNKPYQKMCHKKVKHWALSQSWRWFDLPINKDLIAMN